MKRQTTPVRNEISNLDVLQLLIKQSEPVVTGVTHEEVAGVVSQESGWLVDLT